MNRPLPHLVASLIVIALLSGCGESTSQKDKGFFTSGNREADQRAEQQMSRSEQLNPANEASTPIAAGQTTSKDHAVIATNKRSLYDRLGGDDGIGRIVDDFVDRAMADPRVNWSRTGVKHGGFSVHYNQSEQWSATPENIRAVKMHISQFLEVTTGGPVKYTGKDMHSAHANMHISNPEFDAAMGDMKATLDKLQIANPEQKELLAVVESTREEIVETR
jgi:hemoglobin